MEYPKELLPKVGYKRIESKLYGFYLLRRTLKKNIFDSSTEQLKNEFLEEDGKDIRFLSWSCNLYNLYKYEYLKILITNKYLTKKEWDFETPVETPALNDDYIIIDEYGCYLLDILSVIKNLQVPYSKGKVNRVYARPKLYHSPNLSNFWHFEIRWIDYDNNLISKNPSKWKNTLVASIRSFIRNYCKPIDEINNSDIPKLDISEYS